MLDIYFVTIFRNQISLDVIRTPSLRTPNNKTNQKQLITISELNEELPTFSSIQTHITDDYNIRVPTMQRHDNST